mmetsp:Transcript_19452/g.46688  ORF Transcript_19452/g.46688 Transcript_19452/m.46688 type:complete len:95 (+) Transcript_19452:395-679(+)
MLARQEGSESLSRGVDIFIWQSIGAIGRWSNERRNNRAVPQMNYAERAEEMAGVVVSTNDISIVFDPSHFIQIDVHQRGDGSSMTMWDVAVARS